MRKEETRDYSKKCNKTTSSWIHNQIKQFGSCPYYQSDYILLHHYLIHVLTWLVWISYPQVDTCVFIISTYADGKPPESAEWFCKWLEEASNDFRVQKSLLSGLDYAVFGLGNSLYKEQFNMVSTEGNNFHSI